MDNYGSCESQQKVWRHHILQCSKVGDSELDTAISSKFKHKILYQFCLSAIIKKKMNLNCQKITWEIIFLDPQWQLTP